METLLVPVSVSESDLSYAEGVFETDPRIKVHTARVRSGDPKASRKSIRRIARMFQDAGKTWIESSRSRTITTKD